MKPLYARYPFLTVARDAVEAADVDLAAFVDEGGPVVERGVERVVAALEEGTIGEPHRSPRVEVLSYPVARVLVSLVDVPILVHRYAHAEAARAHELFTDELASRTELKSVRTESISFEELCAEFALDERIRSATEGYEVEVGAYLGLASRIRGDDWRLVNRRLADGWVAVSEEELHALLREAIRQRVADGLPLSVPEGIANALATEVEHLEGLLAELELTREIDTVVPTLFPPCMKALLDSIQKGEHLAHHSRFAITAFLASIGMTTDEIVELYLVNSTFGEEMTRYQTDHIRGDTSSTAYTPPSCATMQSYGDCVNMDDRCERISHPLGYYERSLDDADEDELTDWRDGRDEREESATS